MRLNDKGFTEELTFLTNISWTRQSDTEFPLFEKHPLVIRPHVLTELCRMFHHVHNKY